MEITHYCWKNPNYSSVYDAASLRSQSLLLPITFIMQATKTVAGREEVWANGHFSFPPKT